MKAYRIEGNYSQAVFYVGYRKDVQATLDNFFSKYQAGLKPSKQHPQHQNHPSKHNPHQSPSKQSQSFSSDCPSSETLSASTKHLSLHILLYDLPLTEYNFLKSQLRQKFINQMSKFHDPLVLHLAIVESREESLRYIKKIEKYTQAEFESNLFQLNREVQQNAEYDLIKAYMGQKFGMSRQEVFAWMQATKIKTFKELLGFKDIPSYQKKELRQLLNNLTLLEEIYGGEGKSESKDD